MKRARGGAARPERPAARRSRRAPPSRLALQRRVSLCETLDRVLDRGAVVAGDIVISVADVNLLYIGLDLVVASIERIRARSGGERRAMTRNHKEDRSPRTCATERFEAGRRIWRPSRGSPARLRPDQPRRIRLEPQSVEQGLTRLVLSVIELVRRLLEKQALRRVESGALTPEQVERLGTTLMRLEEQMDELKQAVQDRGPQPRPGSARARCTTRVTRREEPP